MKSCVVGYYYLSDVLCLTHSLHPAPPVHIMRKFLKHVVASGAEAETAGLFYNAQEIVLLHHILTALGHPQPPTPLHTDNTTMSEFSNRTMRQRHSKSWDMSYHCFWDQERRQDLNVFWGKGKSNKADYYTKHFPPSHHQIIQHSQFVSTKALQTCTQKLMALLIREATLQGCVAPCLK